MIKASLTYHDPVDIYDYFKSEFGNLSILIKSNSAIMTFENPHVKKLILDNPRRVIKGLPLTLKPFQEEDPTSKLATSNLNTDSKLMDIEKPNQNSDDLLMLGDSISLPNVYQSLKLIGSNYEKKINQMKNTFLDERICNQKITQFNSFLNKYITNKKDQIQDPFKNLKLAIKRYSLNPQQEIIDLDPKFQTFSNRLPNFSRRFSNFMSESSTQFVEGISYASVDIGSVKRLCLMNDKNFITSLKLNEMNQQKGQLRIYNKDNHTPQFFLDIQEVPYSLMMHENFVLAGDFSGHIHFIDVENQNRSEFSNKLSTGLIVQMQKYDIKSNLPSMLTLVVGSRNEYKLKIFQIEKECISSEINTLTFHPRDQLLCQGITMSLEVIDATKFAYGCGRNTFIMPSFDKRQRDYIIHDQNVMKIKKKNSNQLIEALERKIVLTDLRTSKLKNEFFDFNMELNTIEMLSENHIFYGGKMGEIGLIDCRKPNIHIWNPPQILHKGKIADILKIDNDVVTADANGSIIQWKSNELK